ncbi:unnamed protein product [Miscanthus lutarioriparius]|uniref:Translation elongation factor KOW-like domain-containing protein n=1 Tax=Miscanthus lutarioriparius TaxID=422564 RepID=A0A811QD10_9POAL|nr:unnamed protein product [Miscanthus lutarioriparius]
MDGNAEPIQFSWGKRRATGGVKMDIQFYGSFTLDNVKYSLYDCVYLFKHGETEPYIGKIVKIWEQNNAKKGPVMGKEIFLACGEGTGLADINPLEAVAGKCTVICISKDERNRQPSPQELDIADYIFYRFFDVKSLTLSDQLPDKIATWQVDVLLNPKDELVISSPGTNVLLNPNVDECMVAAVPAPPSAVKTEDGSQAAALPLPQPAFKEVDENPPATVPLSQSEVREEQKPTIAIPLSQPVVKKEDKKSVAAIPLSRSAVKEDEKPVASIAPPRSAVMENIPKHTQLQDAHTGERPPKKLKLSQVTTEQDIAPETAEQRPLELPPKNIDRSKWFKIEWDDRLKMADDKGTLVYIQNLDIRFGPADIEELVRKALQLSCTAKPINHPTYDDPNNGKAYAIFKTKDAADAAILKINSGLVVGGRPLYCSKGLLEVPKPSVNLIGHLSSHVKIGQKQRDEQKKAVATSHCSQPNTIEYDLALEWMLLRERQDQKAQRSTRMLAGVNALSSNDIRVGTNVEPKALRKTYVIVMQNMPANFSRLLPTTEFLHVKPGKGAAFVRTKMRNYVTGNTVD